MNAHLTLAALANVKAALAEVEAEGGALDAKGAGASLDKLNEISRRDYQAIVVLFLGRILAELQALNAK